MRKALLGLALLAACGGGQEPDSEEPTVPACTIGYRSVVEVEPGYWNGRAGVAHERTVVRADGTLAVQRTCGWQTVERIPASSEAEALAKMEALLGGQF